MHYLIYVSQAVRPMNPDELSAILQASRARNTSASVTGLLIYRFSHDENRGNFLQLLEGDRAAVEATWRRIEADSRHHTKIVLEEGDTPDRSFPDWSMGFRNVDAPVLARFGGYADLGSEAFWTRARAGALPEALDLMTSFYES